MRQNEKIGSRRNKSIGSDLRTDSFEKRGNYSGSVKDKKQAKSLRVGVKGLNLVKKKANLRAGKWK